MTLRAWLALLLSLLAAGCSGAAAPPPGAKVEVGNRYLSYDPPAGWKPDGREWWKSGEGRLTVEVSGPDGRRIAAERVAHSLALLGSNPTAAAQALDGFPPRPAYFAHEPEKDRLVALCRQVSDARWRIAKDPKGARAELEEALAGFRALEIGDDPQARARNWFENLNRRGGNRTVESVAAATAGGRPAALAVSRDSHGSVMTNLFLVYEGQLVVFQVNSNGERREVLRSLADGIAFDVSAPGAVAQEPAEPEEERGSGVDWGAWLAPLLPPAVFLLFTSFPAWLGAGFGYDTAAMTGGDVRRGAAGAAFQFTGCGLVVAVFLVVVGLGVLLSGSSGGGIMTPGVAWVIMTVLLLALGLCTGLAGGSLAALGAWLGAGTSRRAAQWMAAVLAAGGALLGPFLLKGFGALPARSKRRALPPPPPVAVVAVPRREAVRRPDDACLWTVANG